MFYSPDIFLLRPSVYIKYRIGLSDVIQPSDAKYVSKSVSRELKTSFFAAQSSYAARVKVLPSDGDTLKTPRALAFPGHTNAVVTPVR